MWATWAVVALGTWIGFVVGAVVATCWARGRIAGLREELIKLRLGVLLFTESDPEDPVNFA